VCFGSELCRGGAGRSRVSAQLCVVSALVSFNEGRSESCVILRCGPCEKEKYRHLQTALKRGGGGRHSDNSAGFPQ